MEESLHFFPIQDRSWIFFPAAACARFGFSPSHLVTKLPAGTSSAASGDARPIAGYLSWPRERHIIGDFDIESHRKKEPGKEPWSEKEETGTSALGLRSRGPASRESLPGHSPWVAPPLPPARLEAPGPCVEPPGSLRDTGLPRAPGRAAVAGWRSEGVRGAGGGRCCSH